MGVKLTKTQYEAGERVQYVKDKIEDVPKGTEGTVVGSTHPLGGHVIVKFDFAEGNRYMAPSHIRPAGRAAISSDHGER